MKRPTLPPFHHFLIMFIRNIMIGILLIAIALYVGMLGYHHFEKLSWSDAFLNASMILSGMGEVAPITTEAGKIFAGCYALFSGLAFIVIIGLIFAPLVKRFLHKIHLESWLR